MIFKANSLAEPPEAAIKVNDRDLESALSLGKSEREAVGNMILR